jgi:mono/diheme cytochrome c family protein
VRICGRLASRLKRLGGRVTALTWLVAVWPVMAMATSGKDDAGFKFFEDKVRPILALHCYECHGPSSGAGKAKLRMDSLDGLLKGGRSGPALVRGEPERSLLILAVRHEGDVAMPPKKKLSQLEIDTLAAWIKMGAPWPAAVEGTSRPSQAANQPRWDERARNHWAFQPRRSARPPKVSGSTWPLGPIDRFILAKLEEMGIAPSAPASRRALLRRATFDLTGLPPSAEEVDAFLADSSPLAFTRVVDRLLASPHYGQRWGRHWLDVARYADSNGMDDNLAYSDAWRFRDYVILSFNADKPYDRFLSEQIAGDLLAEREPARRDELVVATGFLAIGPKMLAEDDPVKQQMDIVDEQLDTVSRVFMAISMGCARCHDHKFDPIDMSDYYGLAGIFKSTRTMLSHRVDSKWNVTGLGTVGAALRLDDLEQIIDRHDNLLVNGNPARMGAGIREAHTRLLEEAKQEYTSIPKAMAVVDGTPSDVEIFLRGNHLTRGALVPRRFPAILSRGERPVIDRTHSGRLELARWLTAPEHPLSSRVIVNRVWRWHFGRGLVASVDNFGRLGQLPTHPELLDWLASWLLDQGWSLKRLHRVIMLSQTYQMGTRWIQHASQVDPENAYLWRMPRRRLDAEVLRDSILFVAGQLDPKIGGTLLQTTPFQDLSAGGASRSPALYESTRRSVYLPVLRGALYEVYRTFDFPDPAYSSGDRSVTTVAAQALFMMNSTIMERASASLAASLLDDSRVDDRARMARACRRILGRPAAVEELELWSAFLDRYQTIAGLSEQDPATARRLAWQGLCRALLSSNEFVYVE